MKKLIIAAAIVCAAVVSQAASYTWGASGVKDALGKNLYSGSATLHVMTMAGASVVDLAGTMTDGAINVVVGDDKISAGTMYKMYYTMYDSTLDSTFTSSTVPAMAQPTAAPGLPFMSNGSWYPIPEPPGPTPTPEPTSGLLLLLGVAGLALRRRRA